MLPREDEGVSWRSSDRFLPICVPCVSQLVCPWRVCPGTGCVVLFWVYVFVGWRHLLSWFCLRQSHCGEAIVHGAVPR